MENAKEQKLQGSVLRLSRVTAVPVGLRAVLYWAVCPIYLRVTFSGKGDQN